MAALIDDEGACPDLDLIGAQIIDDLGALDGGGQTAFCDRAHIHRAHAGGGSVQDQQFRIRVLGQLHRMGQHRLAIGFADRALPDDDQRRPGADVIADLGRGQPLQRRPVIADMGIVIGQVDRLTDQTNLRATRPGATDARVQHRGFIAGVRADQQQHLGAVDVGNRRRADIGRAVPGGQARAIGAAFDGAAQTFDQLLETERSLDRDQIADQTRDLAALHRAGDGFQRLGPRGRAQLAVLADIGPVKALATQPVPDETRLVVDPFFVHAVIVARQDAHDFAALGVNADVAAQSVHHVDGFGLGQFPRAGREGIGLADQRTDRAQVDDIALHVRVQRLVQIAGDLAVLTPAGLAHLGDARDLGREAHAAGAGNAARHMGFDQRAKVQVFGRALGFAVAAEIDAVSHGLILQIAFAALIADRAIQRVVDQQEFHHAFAGLADHRAVGANFAGRAIGPRTQILDLHRARGGGLGRAAHDLDQTHAAVAGDRQALVIAKARHLDAGLFAGLDQGQVGIDLDHLVIDLDLAQICHHVTFVFSYRAPSRSRRNSSRRSEPGHLSRPRPSFHPAKPGHCPTHPHRCPAPRAGTSRGGHP